jgi:hypothetical protein
MVYTKANDGHLQVESSFLKNFIGVSGFSKLNDHQLDTPTSTRSVANKEELETMQRRRK